MREARVVSVMGGSSRSGRGREDTGERISYQLDGKRTKRSSAVVLNLPIVASDSLIPFKTCARSDKTAVLAAGCKQMVKSGAFRGYATELMCFKTVL